MSQDLAQPPKEPLPVVVGRRWRILQGLALRGESHVTELATKLGFKVSDMSTYIDELARRGLVLSRNVPGPMGGERKNVRLSPEGQRIYDFLSSTEPLVNELEVPTREELTICLRAAQPNNRHSIEFRRMLAEKLVELCRGSKIEDTEEGKTFLKTLILNPVANDVDDRIARRLRVGFALVVGRLVKDSQGLQWLLKELYPGISKTVFNETLPVEVRVDFIDALARIYSSLPPQERTNLRRKLLDAYFSNSDPNLHTNLLEIIARARQLKPDRAAVLKTIDEKLGLGNQISRTRAEQLLGHFVYGWSMDKFRTEGIVSP